VLLVPLVRHRPYSLGCVEIISRNPQATPRIRLGLFDHPDDLHRMVSGIREPRSIMESGPLEKHIRAETWPGPDVTFDADHVRTVRQDKNACCHAVGTCVMGGEGNPTAVVDQMGKVHGVDASIMPDIPAEPANTTVTMTVERCADELRRNARPSTARNPPARPAAEPWWPAVPYALSCRTGRTRARSYAPDARPPPSAGAAGERRTGAP
jgi:choline dehydrogenase